MDLIGPAELPESVLEQPIVEKDEVRETDQQLASKPQGKDSDDEKDVSEKVERPTTSVSLNLESRDTKETNGINFSCLNSIFTDFKTKI